MRVSAYPSVDHARQIYADVSFLRAANKGWLPPWPVKDIRLFPDWAWESPPPSDFLPGMGLLVRRTNYACENFLLVRRFDVELGFDAASWALPSLLWEYYLKYLIKYKTCYLPLSKKKRAV